MHITHLSLTNFRNYGRLELALPSGAVLFYGANAQGKTNLLEAIYYLATTRSPHADYDYQLMNWEADETDDPVVVSRLVAQVETAAQRHLVEMRLIKEKHGRGHSFRREVLVNRRKVRLMDMLGNLRVVLFLPSDVELIGAPPAQRRRYLDITLCQTDPVYCRTLSAYNKTLEQRNAALKQLAETGRGRDVLAVYTEKLVSLGAEIFARRARFVSRLAREAQRIHYEALTAGQETIRLIYLPRLQAESLGRGDDENYGPFADTAVWLESQTDLSAIAERFHNTLQLNLERDIGSGHTTIGPHRDDWRFWVNGRSLSSYGSRGQQRSAILALKMAEINRMRDETGEMPVLLLDEVVAELDERRRALLLDYVQSGAQALLTATDPGMFTDTFMEQAASMVVQAGRVTAVEDIAAT
ncbi:MAG: DNA replication/repair protein RecF [Anaerolineales bacterium]|nr:DNA replication/repair protein RecF [Anaerolineales bacterium]